MQTCLKCLYLDALLINADSNSNIDGHFECSSLTAVSILSGASMDVVSATIELFCNITGSGDLSLACSTNNCEMSFSGNVNPYSTSSFHLSNSELGRVGMTGLLTFGSESQRNISNMWLDGVSASFNATTVAFASSRIHYLNSSSTLVLSANSAILDMRAENNLSIGTDFAVEMISGGVARFESSGAS